MFLPDTRLTFGLDSNSLISVSVNPVLIFLMMFIPHVFSIV